MSPMGDAEYSDAVPGPLHVPGNDPSRWGHYYVDPSLWDKAKITQAAQAAVEHTGHSQLIHPHLHKDPCGDIVHFRWDPGATEAVETRRGW